jgi:hypothetical protein
MIWSWYLCTLRLLLHTIWDRETVEEVILYDWHWRWECHCKGWCCTCYLQKGTKNWRILRLVNDHFNGAQQGGLQQNLTSWFDYWCFCASRSSCLFLTITFLGFWIFNDIVDAWKQLSTLPEEEFLIREKEVPRWSRLLDRAVHPPFQQLFHTNSTVESDVTSNLWFPSLWMLSLWSLCTSIWLRKA